MNRNVDAYGVEFLSRYFDPGETPIDYQIEILRYCKEKRGERLGPRWDEISLPESPPKAVPLLSVTDLVEKPLQSTYRFWGSGLSEVFGTANFWLLITGRCAASVSSSAPTSGPFPRSIFWATASRMQWENSSASLLAYRRSAGRGRTEGRVHACVAEIQSALERRPSGELIICVCPNDDLKHLGPIFVVK